MKAHVIETPSPSGASGAWRGDPTTISLGLLAQARGLEIVAALATRLAATLMPALALIIGATLLVSTPGLAVYLQAALWAVGFLFYALAVESEKPPLSGGLLVSGLLIHALALGSRLVAPELAVAGTAVAAAWLAGSVARILFRAG